MKKWIAAVTITEAALAIVVNLATSRSALWLWYLLGVLVVANIAVRIHDAAVRRDRQTAPEVMTPPNGPVSVRMSASWFGKILHSPVKIRQR